MYLLIGRDRALLLDTGACESASACPVAETVLKLVSEHAATAGQPHSRPPLVVAHSHSHRDHFAGDGQFGGAEAVTVVPPELKSVKLFFGLQHWPNGTATFDLGGRVLDVFPIPGHEQSHIAIYDQKTKILLTGDTLYPGLLVVENWTEYTATTVRLKAFVESQPVSFVLGAHVEMTDQPKRWFGLGTLYQPGEHRLQLEARHVVELHAALQTIGPHPRVDRHDEFIIYPRGHPLPPTSP
jgi:glyoxylase-like metal-dependent hydrolase (beta-lactamase superfamily II)